jgi:hypothetical protein
MYYPIKYDISGESYEQANQEIAELGYLDPVELWTRSQSQESSPDDFIATISIQGPVGDPSGEAIFTVVDANMRPRFNSFVLPSAATAPTPVGVGTRYGVPLLSGDLILCSWLNRPATGDNGVIIINLMECDGCEWQRTAAQWLANQGDEPVPCSPPSIISILPVGGPIFEPGIGTWTLAVQGIDFEPTDEWDSPVGPITVQSVNFIDSANVEVTIDIGFPGLSSGPYPINVNRVGDPTCAATGSFFIVPPA